MVAAAERPEGAAGGDRRARGRGQPDRRRRHVVRLQRGQQRGDAEVRAALLAGDAGDPGARLRLAGRRRAAADADDRRAGRLGRRPLPRHADLADLDLGDELRADVRAGAGHRLRAVHRDALPQRAVRPGPGAGRRGRGDDGHGRQGGPLLRPDRADLALGGDAGAQPGLPLGVAGDHDRGAVRPGGDADAAAGGAGQARPAGRQARPPLGAQRRPPLAALRPLGRAALAAAVRLRRRSRWSPWWRWRCPSSA